MGLVHSNWDIEVIILSPQIFLRNFIGHFFEQNHMGVLDPHKLVTQAKSYPDKLATLLSAAKLPSLQTSGLQTWLYRRIIRGAFKTREAQVSPMAIKPGEQKGIQLQDFFKFPTRFQCTDTFEDQCFRQVLLDL